MEIKNFIPTYPQPEDEDLTIKISHLEDFAQLQLQRDETKPKMPGTPFLHQEAQARYFSVNTMYNAGVIVHEPGSGKTCTASLIVERFKNSLVNGKLRKQALIMVRNSALRDAFRNEISKICTKDLYFAKFTDSENRDLEDGLPVELTEEAERRRLNLAISKTYEIVKYSDILDSKSKKGKGGLPSDEIIIRDYSNRVIIIDEIQNIRSQSSSKNKKVNDRYSKLHHFLHVVENCTILLLSGTPIWDSVYDIAGVFNLILPLNSQFSTGKNFEQEFYDEDRNFRPEKVEEFKSKIKGTVSYLRALTSSAVRKEIGIIKPWLRHMIAYPSAMSELQSKCEKDARVKVIKTIDKDKESGGSFYSDARDAANCVYPSVKTTNKCSYGTAVFEENAVLRKTVKKVNKKGKEESITKLIAYKFLENKNNVANAFRPAGGADPFANLRKYSAKFATMIEMMIDPNRFKEKIFIYNDSVSGTGGCLSLALIMQLWKFKWVKSAEGAPEADISADTVGNFVVITSEDKTINTAAQIRETLEVYNRDNNIYGRKVRIIMGSETISQGYTIKAVRQGHIVKGHWNMSSLDQAMFRIFRIGSHDQLPEEERYVNIYRHIAVVKGKNWSIKNQTISDVPPPKNTFSTDETVDIIIYKIAEGKEYMSSQIYRYMKESSWDCALNYKRNVLINDIDGSRACDFQKCNFVCDNFTEENGLNKNSTEKFLNKKQGTLWSYDLTNTDKSNYNLLYSGKETENYIKMIIDLFHNYFSLKYDILKGLLPGYEPSQEFILMVSLSKIINNRIPIRDRYGFKAYLSEEGNIYFLDGYISPHLSYQSSIYSTFPLINEISSLQNAVETIRLKDDSQFIEKFVKTPSLVEFQK